MSGEYKNIECPLCGNEVRYWNETGQGLIHLTCGWCDQEFFTKIVNPEVQTYDICARKHGGNPESVEANAHTGKNMGRQRVIEWMEARGAQGDITYGIAKALGMPYTTASARVSELRKMGVLVPKPKPGGGYFRDKTPTGSSAAVLILKEHAPLEFDKNGQSKLL